MSVQGRMLGREQRQAAMRDLHRFTALNALSFEVLAGQILILFARQAGASIADIGLLSALLPFASVIQLGVAPLVNRFGPRALMLAGWGARTVVSALLFLVPIAASSGPGAATRTILVIMAAFYLCRALGMSSWLPMIQEIVPSDERGVFLSRQEWLRQVSIVLIAVVTAIYLVGVTGLTRFLHVIGIGVVAAGASLYFLWRVPDVGGSAEPFDREYLRRATAPLRDRVFRRYLFFSATLRMVLSAYPPFLTVFLRDGLGYAPSGVIAVNTIGSLGAILTLPIWGKWTDRVGAKPALGLTIGGVAGALLLWIAAGQGPEWRWLGAPAVSLILGIFNGGLTVAVSRFELGFIPVRGRAHYVAMNVTLVGLTSGLSTFLAGRLLQALEPGLPFGGIVLDRYEGFFLIVAMFFAAPVLVRRSLPEERARSLRALVRRELRRRSLRMLRMLRGKEQETPEEKPDEKPQSPE